MVTAQGLFQTPKEGIWLFIEDSPPPAESKVKMSLRVRACVSVCVRESLCACDLCESLCVCVVLCVRGCVLSHGVLIVPVVMN